MISRDWINRALQVRHFTLGAETDPINRSTARAESIADIPAPPCLLFASELEDNAQLGMMRESRDFTYRDEEVKPRAELVIQDVEIKISGEALCALPHHLSGDLQ